MPQKILVALVATLVGLTLGAIAFTDTSGKVSNECHNLFEAIERARNSLLGSVIKDDYDSALVASRKAGSLRIQWNVTCYPKK